MRSIKWFSLKESYFGPWPIKSFMPRDSGSGIARQSLKASFAVLCLSLLAGCAPLTGQDLKETLSALAQDKASACIQIGGGAGTGAIVPGPGIPVGGGYGFFWFGRANEPNSRVTIDSQGCKIEHGVK